MGSRGAVEKTKPGPTGWGRLLSGLRQRLRGDWIAARAVVVTIPDGSPPHTHFWADVHVEGRDPYLVRHECSAPRDRWVTVGTVMPILVDSRHRERIRVEWDRVPATDAEMARSGPGSVRSAGGARDLAGQLRQLAELHSAGALSDAEFRRAKARVLQ